MVKDPIWLPEHSSLQHDWVCISLRREGLTFAMAAQEVDREASQGHVNQEQLRHMPYTEACVKEALRLYPPATALARQLTQDMQIMGHSVPKGTGIFVRPPSLLPVCPQRVVHVPQACRSILPHQCCRGVPTHVPVVSWDTARALDCRCSKRALTPHGPCKLRR